MPGHDTLLLVIAGCVACELENLGCEVLEYCSEVDCSHETSGGQILLDS